MVYILQLQIHFRNDSNYYMIEFMLNQPQPKDDDVSSDEDCDVIMSCDDSSDAEELGGMF